MPLTPLTPTVMNLGYLRFCRDDLEQIVSWIRSLNNVSIEANVMIDLEADGNKLDDVETDLPRLGDRLSYFTLKAYNEVPARRNSRRARLPPDAPSLDVPPAFAEILVLSLSTDSCTLATTSRDLDTRGVISAIRELADERRRAPAWFPHLIQKSVIPKQSWSSTWWALVTVAAIFGPLVGLTITSENNPHHLLLSTPSRISIGIIGALILLFVLVGSLMSRTVLLTSLHTESPGWWKRNRDGFVVGMITGIVTGLLTGAAIYLLTRP